MNWINSVQIHFHLVPPRSRKDSSRFRSISTYSLTELSSLSPQQSYIKSKRCLQPPAQMGTTVPHPPDLTTTRTFSNTSSSETWESASRAYFTSSSNRNVGGLVRRWFSRESLLRSSGQRGTSRPLNSVHRENWPKCSLLSTVMADCPHTIGVEFGTRIIEVCNQKIKLQIWWVFLGWRRRFRLIFFNFHLFAWDQV